MGFAELPENVPVSIAFVGLPRATGAGLLSNLPVSTLGLGGSGVGMGGGSTFATTGGGVISGVGISSLGGAIRSTTTRGGAVIFLVMGGAGSSGLRSVINSMDW